METDIIYLCLHKALLRKSENNLLSTKRILAIMGQSPFYIPRDLKYPILKGMREEEIIIQLNRDLWKIPNLDNNENEENEKNPFNSLWRMAVK